MGDPHQPEAFDLHFDPVADRKAKGPRGYPETLPPQVAKLVGLPSVDGGGEVAPKQPPKQLDSVASLSSLSDFELYISGQC